MTRPTAQAPSLRRQFAKVMLLAVLLPALLLIAGFIWLNITREQAAVDMRTVSVATAAARDVDEFIAGHRAAIQLLAQTRSEDGDAGDAARWRADLRRLRRNYPGFKTTLVTDARGAIIESDPLPETPGPRDVSDRSYFTEPARTGKPYISNAFRGRGLGNDPLVAVSAPWLRGGGFAGVVEGSILTSAITATRFQALQSRMYEVLLVDGQGQVIHASDGIPMQSLDPLAGSGFEALLAPGAAPPQGVTLLRGVLRGHQDAFAAHAELDSGWRLAILVPKHILDAQVRDRVIAPLVLLVIFAFGVIGASWQQMRALQAGIERLLQTLRGFALGGKLSPTHVRGMPRELQPVLAAIGELGDRLNSAYGDLSEALEKQRELADSMRALVATREREIAERTEELRNAVAELDRISRTDALTGCLNYRGYREAATALWRDSAADGSPLSVLAMDIDLFKPYNDRYGHQAGDHALRRFAGAARSALYHHGDTLVRTGGEEFVVFLPGTPLEQALEVAERVRNSVLRAEITHEDSPGGLLTVSVGVAAREPTDGADPESMLRRADEALYKAKHAGRNRVAS